MFDKKTKNSYAFIWSNTYNSEKKNEFRIEIRLHKYYVETVKSRAQWSESFSEVANLESLIFSEI